MNACNKSRLAPSRSLADEALVTSRMVTTSSQVTSVPVRRYNRIIHVVSVIAAFLGGHAGGSVTAKVVHGVSWQMMTNLVGRVGTFAIAVIQARLLGKSGYGELGMVLSTLTLFGLVSSAVGGQTCTKSISESRHSNRMAAERIAGLGIAMTTLFSALTVLAVFVWGEHLAVQALKRSDLAPLLWLAGIALAFQALTGTISGILLGLHEFRSDGMLRLAQIAAWLPLTALLTPQRGTFGAMLAYTLSQGIGLAAYGTYAARICRRERFAVRFSGMWAESAVLLRYSLPLMLNGLLCVPTIWWCNAILARQPGGYAALGGYTAATQFRTIVIQLPMLIQGVVWPLMAEMYGARKMASLGNLFQNSFEVLWALGLLAALPMIAFGGSVMRVFGRSFEADHLDPAHSTLLQRLRKPC